MMATKRKTANQREPASDSDAALELPLRIDMSDAVPVTIRFPRIIHRALSDAAQANGNSFNSEIVHRLAGSLNNATAFERLNKMVDDGSDITELAAEFARLAAVARLAAASRKK